MTNVICVEGATLGPLLEIQAFLLAPHAALPQGPF